MGYEDDDDEESPEGGAPPVPSRQESYHLTGGGGQHDGLSGEGLYEQLPSEGGSSSSPPGRGGASLSSDNEAPPENGTDHLVRPSQLRKRRSLQAELYRQQPYPSSDSLESRVPPAPPTLVTFGGGGGGPSPLSAPPPPPLAEAAPRCAPPPRLCTTGRRSQSRDAPPPPSFPTAGLRKSSSLKASYGLGVGRAAPVVPPVAPVPTEEQDATHSDSITDDDDTISSSGLSGGGVWADPFPYAGRGDEWPSAELYYQRTGSKQAPPLKPKPKGHHQQQPGKLNLRQFDHLTEAISRLQLSGPGHKPPLALPDEDTPSPQEAVYGGGVERAALLLPEGKHRVRSLARRHASREHEKAKTKLPGMLPTDDSVAYDSATLGELTAGARQLLKDKSTTRKKDERKKAREDEKTEKRRLKEEERQKRLTEKKKKKQGNSPAGVAPTAALEEFAQSEAVRTPLFVEQCVRFIEQEGLDSEGLYRVPGNRAHVELLLQRLDEGADLVAELGSSELPVNAVATALKDFFSKTRF